MFKQVLVATVFTLSALTVISSMNASTAQQSVLQKHESDLSPIEKQVSLAEEKVLKEWLTGELSPRIFTWDSSAYKYSIKISLKKYDSKPVENYLTYNGSGYSSSTELLEKDTKNISSTLTMQIPSNLHYNPKLVKYLEITSSNVKINMHDNYKLGYTVYKSNLLYDDFLIEDYSESKTISLDDTMIALYLEKDKDYCVALLSAKGFPNSSERELLFNRDSKPEVKIEKTEDGYLTTIARVSSATATSDTIKFEFPIATNYNLIVNNLGEPEFSKSDYGRYGVYSWAETSKPAVKREKSILSIKSKEFPWLITLIENKIYKVRYMMEIKIEDVTGKKILERMYEKEKVF